MQTSFVSTLRIRLYFVICNNEINPESAIKGNLKTQYRHLLYNFQFLCKFQILTTDFFNLSNMDHTG